jgi:hypothetical protein
MFGIFTQWCLRYFDCSLSELWRKEFDAEQKSKKEAYEKTHLKKDNQYEGWVSVSYNLSGQLLLLFVSYIQGNLVAAIKKA